jgi:hypothetical protein
MTLNDSKISLIDIEINTEDRDRKILESPFEETYY